MNGIPFLDAIPVNWFILGTSVLAGVILFLILTQTPDEDEEKEAKEESNSVEEKSTPSRSALGGPAPKKRPSKK